MDKQKRHQLLVDQADAARQLIAIWGSGNVGPLLIQNYYSEEPWVSVAEMALRTHLSVAQMRRRLEKLRGEAKVARMTLNGQHLFLAEPDHAERSFDIIAAPAIAFCNAA